MPKFVYVAKNKDGKEIQGETDTSNRRDVVERLRKDGFWPVSIEEVEKKKLKKGSISDRIFTVPLKNKTIFCRHLAVMIGSGLSISKALMILASQEKNKTLQKVSEKMANNVREGISFADAIGKYPRVFNAVFVSMIRMGEISGNLEEVLKILADQLEKDHKLISKVRGAMIYPSIIVGAMIIIGILMMIFVIPKVTGIFKDFGVELPIATRIVIFVSDFMAANVWVTLGSLVSIVVGTSFFAKTKAGKRLFHKLFLKAPVLGSIVVKVNSARFSRILSSLLESGTSLVEALDITADTLGNYYFKKATREASKEVQKGIELSDILGKNRGVFPYLVVQMTEVGEETGKTPEILKKLASFYEDEVSQITQNLSSIIEPVLMIIIGAAVGLFAIAIIQPIYSVMGQI